jgi:hypothetical protein
MSGDRRRDVIGKLTAAQALELVERLCRRGGRLREMVMAEATNLLGEVDMYGTSDGVLAGLESINVEERWDRSGNSYHGYTSPDEAATELIEEALQPFVDQVERYHQLCMLEQKARYCTGIISGLYRYERESKAEFRAWSEDIAGDCAALLPDQWRKRNPAEAGIAGCAG